MILLLLKILGSTWSIVILLFGAYILREIWRDHRGSYSIGDDEPVRSRDVDDAENAYRTSGFAPGMTTWGSR